MASALVAMVPATGVPPCLRMKLPAASGIIARSKVAESLTLMGTPALESAG